MTAVAGTVRATYESLVSWYSTSEEKRRHSQECRLKLQLESCRANRSLTAAS